jgi:hypothetical protein
MMKKNNKKKPDKKNNISKALNPVTSDNGEVSKEEWVRLNLELFGEDNSDDYYDDEGDETQELNFDNR